MKIAIIDSGINYMYRNAGFLGKHIYIYKNKICFDDNFYEKGMHGTLVYYTIKSIFPKTECYNIKILDENGRTNSLLLISALQYLLNIECNIINISLSTYNMINFNDISMVCNKLEKQNKIIVASGDSQGVQVLPAMLDSVIGVSGSKYFKDEVKYNTGIYECVVNDEMEFINVGNKRNSAFAGTSKGAAIVSGLISKCLYNKNSTMSKKEFIEMLKKKPLEYGLKNGKKNDEVLQYVIKKYGTMYAEQIFSYCYNSIENIIEFLDFIDGICSNHRRVFLSDFSSEKNIRNLLYYGWK